MASGDHDEGKRAGDSADVRSKGELIQEVRVITSPALPEAELYELHYRGFGIPAQFRYRNSYAIAIVEVGKSVLSYAGKRIECTVGTVGLSRPFESAKMVRRASEELRLRAIMLDSSMIEAVLSSVAERWRRESGLGYIVAPTPQLGESVERLFRSMLEPESTLQKQAAAWACAEQVGALYAGALSESVPSPEHVRRAREYLHAHYTEDIDLNKLTAAVGDIHPRYLLALFTQTVNLSPHQYVLHLRVHAARELLRKGWSAARAARQTGFYDQSQLHRHFVRIMGLTPGAYARACK